MNLNLNLNLISCSLLLGLENVSVLPMMDQNLKVESLQNTMMTMIVSHLFPKHLNRLKRSPRKKSESVESVSVTNTLVTILPSLLPSPCLFMFITF